MSKSKLKIVLPIVALVAAVAVAAVMVGSRKPPTRTERPALGPLVEVIHATVSDVPVVVEGHGEVSPKVAVEVMPQVSGQVVQVHPSLVSGGFFAAHEELLLIDPRDYELAVARAEATVARARVSLEQQQAEAVVALQEWDELNPGVQPPSGLVVREPQVHQAKAELAAAEADLETARLNLERTRVSLPFDGVVVSEVVDLGQFVGAGSRLATVYGTDLVEVRLPMEDRELAWFDLPNGNGVRAPRAEVSTTFAGGQHSWQGRVTRMEAQVDRSSRMVHVVVEVPRPYAAGSGKPALLPGTFVDVRIFGRTLSNVVPIPRHAVRHGDQVWVCRDGQLEMRPVEVMRTDREQALVTSGLEAGEKVIVSSLDVVTDGMKVRANNGEQADGGAA